MVTRKIGFLFAGTYFGFVLSRVGASDYDMIFDLFTGRDFRLAGVLIVAILTAHLGLRLLRFLHVTMWGGGQVVIRRKPLQRYSLVGGALFGIGWGMAGACPGTALAQVGEGKVLAFFTFAGLIAGTLLYAHLYQRWTGLRR